MSSSATSTDLLTAPATSGQTAPGPASTMNTSDPIFGAKLAPATAASTNPTNNVSTTTLSNGNKIAAVTGIQAKTASLADTGIRTDPATGIATTANGQAYTPPKSILSNDYNADGTTTVTYSDGTKESKPGLTPQGTTQSGGYFGDQYIAPGSAAPTDANGNPQPLTDMPKSAQTNVDSMNALISKNDANTASLIASIKAQYENLIAQQKQTNAGTEAKTNAYTMGGGRGVVSSDNVMNQQVSYGLQQVADLTGKEAQAVSQAQIAGDNQDFQLQDKINTQIETIRKEKQDAATKIADTIATAKKDMQVAQQKVTDSVNQIATDAAKNGADKATIATITSSKDVQSAIAAAGGSLQSATGVLGDYLQYKKDAQAKGLVPLDYTSFKDQQDAKAAKAKNQDAYNNAYNTAAGKAAADAKFGTGSGSGGLPPDVASATTFLAGKSPTQVAAFNSLSDVDKTSVMQVINGDALMSDLFASRGIQGSAARQKFLNQAKAVDPTFSENLNKQRFAYKNQFNNPNGKEQTQINTINTALGHLAEFKQASDALGNKAVLPYNKLVNYLKVNTGDPAVSNLNTVITALAGELAGAYKGGTAPTDQETEQWRNTILASFSKDQAKGVADTTSNLISNKLQSLAQSYKNVMGSYPTSPIINADALKQLQDAGVDTSAIEGKLNVQGYTPQVDPKSEVNTYIKTNPTQSDTIAKMYEVPGATDQDIYDYLKANGQIK